MIPLFDTYPALSQNLSRVPLMAGPTPVEAAPGLGERIGVPGLWVKRDDISGGLYGGNKVRKLEFLLARAVDAGVREVLTFGCAGSNHALATALYAKKIGLGAILLLVPQPNSRRVRENLLADFFAGARIRHFSHALAMAGGTAAELARGRRRTGRTPFVIPFGGSSPEGVAGYVNAAFELAAQVRAGQCPEPDEIWTPLGSMGTAAGLALGLWAAGLKSTVMGVRVVDSTFANPPGLTRLMARTAKVLHKADATFPEAPPQGSEPRIVDGFIGRGYGSFTRECMEAVGLAALEGISLEGTYTGKALGALAHRGRTARGMKKTVLFWNTANSRDLFPRIAGMDYRNLPKAVHRYFEELIQPLDR
ncbi:MAG: pyridoxal-phosphate dependent enzyme [Proteobacteria bacterium]|nr:pyridoxal-phosphate dependent enzyme [Pseudomonadota bacterium]